jgi:hypothetical protein
MHLLLREERRRSMSRVVPTPLALDLGVKLEILQIVAKFKHVSKALAITTCVSH